MSVDDITQLTIVVSSATLSKPGFGTPLALVTDVPAGWGTAKVRQFSKVSELVDLGFTSAHPAYKIATRIKSQNPAPSKFKLAARKSSRKPASSIHVKCLSSTEADAYSIEVGVGGGATSEITRTVPGSSSAAAEATALATLITAVSGIDATNGNSAAVAASLVVDGAGPGRDGEVTYTAVTAGTAGNSITVRHQVSGTATPLSVAVASSAIVVHLETDIGGLPISTANEVVAAIVASGPASALVTASAYAFDDDGEGLAAAVAVTNLALGAAAGAATDTIYITPVVAGKLVNVKNWNKFFTVTDATPDEGVADDLDDVLAEDSDWYGVLLDSNSKAEVLAAASWTEANGKLFAYNTSDTGVADSGSTTDVAYAMKALAYDRSFGIYNANELGCYAGAAWMGRGFAFDPGKITWAFKDLKGVAVDALNTGTQGVLEGKNCNFYVAKYGKPITWEGKLASGEWIDVTHGLDWFDTEMRVQMFQAVSSLPKLPFTIAGLGVLEASGKSVMQAAVRRGLFADNDNLYFRMPALADIDAATKAQRLVPDIEFGADLAGAIHKTKASGLIKN